MLGLLLSLRVSTTIVRLTFSDFPQHELALLQQLSPPL
jgi:hypothetical protein